MLTTAQDTIRKIRISQAFGSGRRSQWRVIQPLAYRRRNARRWLKLDLPHEGSSFSLVPFASDIFHLQHLLHYSDPALFLRSLRIRLVVTDESKYIQKSQKHVACGHFKHCRPLLSALLPWCCATAGRSPRCRYLSTDEARRSGHFIVPVIRTPPSSV